MGAQSAALVIEPAPELRELLRVVLEEDGYTAQTTPDVAAGLRVLRDSASPLIVVFDVLPLPALSHEQSGLALLDALAPGTPEKERLAQHGYVLLSTSPEQAMAGVETLPPHLQVLRKPFRLEDLHASLQAVDDWLRVHPIPKLLASDGGLSHARRSITASRRVLGKAFARLERDPVPTAAREDRNTAGEPQPHSTPDGVNEAADG
jgi:DNA-binding response OmpR family regulator